jgi:hypothetical protein
LFRNPILRKFLLACRPNSVFLNNSIITDILCDDLLNPKSHWILAGFKKLQKIAVEVLKTYILCHLHFDENYKEYGRANEPKEIADDRNVNMASHIRNLNAGQLSR